MLSKSIMSCSFEVLTGAGGSERTKALDGTAVGGFDTEFSMDPVVTSFEVTGCALECLQ